MPLVNPQRPARKAAELATRGLLSENHLPAVATQTTAPTSQTIYGGLLGFLAGDVVTNIGVLVQTAAAGTAPTTIKLGLVSTAGVVLGATANVKDDAKWNATGPKLFALTTPYQIPADGGYYAVFLINGSFGTTNVQIARCNSVAGTDTAVTGFAAPAATGGTGQTDITGTLTIAASGNSAQFWFGAS